MPRGRGFPLRGGCGGGGGRGRDERGRGRGRGRGASASSSSAVPSASSSAFQGSCYYCGQYGHRSRDCRKRQRDQAASMAANALECAEPQQGWDDEEAPEWQEADWGDMDAEMETEEQPAPSEN